MKLKEKSESPGIVSKTAYLLYLSLITLTNVTANPLLRHMNKRGVLTMYWVLNDDDEVQHVMNHTSTASIMTDRP